MNYLLVNGYKQSFGLFNTHNGNEVNLKSVANHKDKINNDEEVNEFNLNMSGVRYRSNSQLRKDSEGIRSRRTSLMKIESQKVIENEEVLKLLSHRHSIIIRHKNVD